MQIGLVKGAFSIPPMAGQFTVCDYQSNVRAPIFGRMKIQSDRSFNLASVVLSARLWA